MVVEGNYLLHGEGGWAEARPLLDLTLFVGLERGIRLARARSGPRSASGSDLDLSRQSRAGRPAPGSAVTVPGTVRQPHDSCGR